MSSLLRIAPALCLGLCLAVGSTLVAQAPRKRLLVIGEEKGYRHEAVTHAMTTIERLGKETGLWDSRALARTYSTTSAQRPGANGGQRRGLQ